ncbi:MAG: hypothetical protein RR620_13130 [Clostridium sp.]
MSRKLFHAEGSTKLKKTRNKNKIKQKLKIDKAKICLSCENNTEGYCSKHKGWCRLVNYICQDKDKPVVITDVLVDRIYKQNRK